MATKRHKRNKKGALRREALCRFLTTGLWRASVARPTALTEERPPTLLRLLCLFAAISEPFAPLCGYPRLFKKKRG